MASFCRRCGLKVRPRVSGAPGPSRRSALSVGLFVLLVGGGLFIAALVSAFIGTTRPSTPVRAYPMQREVPPLPSLSHDLTSPPRPGSPNLNNDWNTHPAPTPPRGTRPGYPSRPGQP